MDHRKKHLAKAKKFAKTRGIPCIPARNGRAILTELEKDGLYSFPVDPKDSLEATVEVEAPAVGWETMDRFDLFENYGFMATEVINALFVEGEELEEADILKELEEQLGVPAEKLVTLIKDLLGEAVLTPHPTREGVVIIPPTAEGHEYRETSVDRSQTFRRKKKELRLDSVSGICEGPYANRSEIMEELSIYEEFMKEDGTPGSRSRLGGMIKEALDAGVIVKKGKFYQVIRKDVKLTHLKDAPVYIYPRKKKHKVKKVSPPTDEAELTIDEMVEKIDFSEAAFRFCFAIKRLVASVYWDECATTTLQRFHNGKQKRSHIDNDSFDHFDRRSFTEDQWNKLAWETMKKFPLEVVILSLQK